MLYSYTLWLTPLWASLPSLGAITIFLKMVIKYVTAGQLPFSFILSHSGLPTLAATLAWRYASSNSTLFFRLAPLLAVILFVSRVGFSPDILFILTWAAPVIVSLISDTAARSSIGTALLASITAHMVGTLLVLFWGVPVAWATLAPLVPFERLLSVVGIIIVAQCIAVLRRAIAARASWLA